MIFDRNFFKSLWHTAQIAYEFFKSISFQGINSEKNLITIFGSARTDSNSTDYHNAVLVGKVCVELGYGVITGGGMGIMEGANRGAFQAGGVSLGVNIRLPMEQKTNPYTTNSIVLNHFFIRKILLTKNAKAFIIMPGGFGTLDELSEIITLIQTQKKNKIPIILFNKKFWGPFLDWIHTILIREYKTVDQSELDFLHLVDTPIEITNIIPKIK